MPWWNTRPSSAIFPTPRGDQIVDNAHRRLFTQPRQVAQGHLVLPQSPNPSPGERNHAQVAEFEAMLSPAPVQAGSNNRCPVTAVKAQYPVFGYHGLYSLSPSRVSRRVLGSGTPCFAQ